MIQIFVKDMRFPLLLDAYGGLLTDRKRELLEYYYNDDLSNGGFAEFENGGVTVGPGTGRDRSSSISTTWYFFGGQEAIGRIMGNLLGIEFEF